MHTVITKRLFSYKISSNTKTNSLSFFPTRNCARKKERRRTKKKMAAERSMKMVGALYGATYCAENLIECGTVDCLLTSSNGYSLWAHHILIIDWLGSNVPHPNERNQIVLPISDSATRLLIDVIYHRRNASTAALLELIDYCIHCGWYQLADDLIENGIEDIVEEGLPRCWIYARKQNLSCHTKLLQKVGDIALSMVRQRSPGIEDLLSIPVFALIDLIGDEHVFLENGKACLELIFAWSLQNPQSATTCCKELFQSIRFKSPSERRQVMMEYREFFQGLGMDEYSVIEATKTYSSIKPRIPRSFLVFLGGWIHRKASDKAYYYDLDSNHWSAIPKLNLVEKLSYFKCQMVNKKLYIVGGFSNGTFRPAVYKFDFEKLKWEPCAALNETKGYYAVTTMNNQIFVIGGSDSRQRLASFDCYDIQTNTWSSLPPLPGGRSDAAALTYRNRIWVFGGFDGSRTLSRVESYDPATRSWTEMQPMDQPRSGHCVVLFKDRMYVIGGFQHGSSTDTVEYYDAGRWKHAPPMSVPRSNFDAVVYNDCIYVFGGHVSEESIANCEKFDGLSWSPVHSLPRPIAAGGVVLLDKPANAGIILNRL